jgi:hypothetical protein
VGIYDGVAGFFDAAAGSTDEAVGRQFDDTPGGGLRAGFGEELGSSRASFLTGAGQYVGLVPRGTAEQRQQAAGPGVQEEGTNVWGGGSVNADGSTNPLGGDTAKFQAIAAVVAVGVLLWLLRPVLSIVAGVSN